MTDTAHQWEKLGGESGELYRGKRLREAQDWMKGHGEQLSPLERKFLKASQNIKRRENLRWVGVAVEIGGVLLLLIILGATGKLDLFVYRPMDMRDYWVNIPAGKFRMGSENGDNAEKPVHTVYLDAFEMGRYEVTNRQYTQCVKAGICSAPV